MSSLAIVKALLLVASGGFYWIQLVPPHLPASSREKVYSGQSFERVAGWWSPLINRLLVLIACCWDALFTLVVARVIPWDIDSLCAASPRATSAGNVEALHPALLFGVGTTILFSCLRLWCFRELGEMFTFEVTIRPKHKLITTGPYAYVRHPSYTGTFGTILGALIIHFSPGNWNQECVGMSTRAAWLVTLWVLISLYALRGLFKRTFAEDEKLEATFGKEYRTYRERVPYRLIPYVV